MKKSQVELQQAIYKQTIEEISQAFITRPNMDSFAQQVVDITRDNFKLYFVSLWMVNEKEQTVLFQFGNGEAGRVLRQHKHQVPIDSKGMVATAVRENKVVIDSWISSQGYFAYPLPLNAEKEFTLSGEFVKEPARPSPLFPSSRSEMIVPLRMEEKPIGALDIHSDREDEFDQQSIFVFLPLADHIAAQLNRLGQAG